VGTAHSHNSYRFERRPGFGVGRYFGDALFKTLPAAPVLGRAQQRYTRSIIPQEHLNIYGVLLQPWAATRIPMDSFRTRVLSTSEKPCRRNTIALTLSAPLPVREGEPDEYFRGRRTAC
jgi:hypothetical protein